jgi:hypothetical protein
MRCARASTVWKKSGLVACGVGILLCSMPQAGLSKAACEFNVPDDWSRKTTQWDGNCLAGRAEGLGVLKEYSNKKVKRFFFGRLKGGEIEFGVIDQEEGFVAGSFANGQPISSDDRQTFINAFNEAEKAASQAASRFNKAGNRASAGFYERKAKELREQMD